MTQNFYSLPLSLERIMQKKEHPICTLQQSVAQHLHLIFTTAFGEMTADENFGCNIWEHDFDNITSGHKMKELIKQSLIDAIGLHEKRIAHVYIAITVRQEELEGNCNYSVKKRIQIAVTGTIQATNEVFQYQESFFTGPLCYHLK